MRHLWIIVLLAIAVGCNVPCRADSVIPAKLRVADAVSLALGMNPDLKQAEESKHAALANLRIAGFGTALDFGTSTHLYNASGSSDLNSLISSKLSFENPFGTSASLELSPLGLGSNRGAVGVSLRQALRKGFGVLSSKGMALKSAESNATVETRQLFIARQATVQSVVEAYYGAVLARDQVAVREQAVTNAKKLADEWRAKEKEQIAAGIDVTRSDIQVAQSENALNSQQRDARNALDRLMMAIGGGLGATPEMIDTVPDVDPQIPPLADDIKTALANRGELTIYDENLAEQERQLSLAKDQLHPQLDLVAGFNGSRDSEGFLSRSIFNSGALTAGLEYSLPLDRRIVAEKKDLAIRQLDVLRNLRLFQTDQIVEQVRTAYRRVEAARASIDILTTNKKSAQDNVGFAELMVANDVGTSRDIVEAQQALTEADNSLLSAKTDLYLAVIDLKRVTGEDLTKMEFK